jgi:hypothetical protein
MQIEEKVRNARDRILAISPRKSLQTWTSTFFSNAESRLDDIARRVVGGKSRPLVLWNLRPWDTFNLLHAVYCVKLADLIDLGFNCVVVLYDKFIQKRTRIPNAELPSLQAATKKCVNRLVRAGLDESKTEFITEADLLSLVKPEEFADKITSFAHLCDFDKGWAERDDAVSLIVDNLCEVYYESVIKCDVLLTGDVDIQRVWGMLRSKILDKNLLPDYSPPLVLFYPTLIGTDKQPLSTSSDGNSLSIQHSSEEVKYRLRTCGENFLATLFDFFIFPWKKTIEIDGRISYSFEEVREKSSIGQIRDLASNCVNDYFYKVRGTKL